MSSKETKKSRKEKIVDAWKDLKNGTKVKAKMTERIEEKLDDLIALAKDGNWKKQLEEAIVQMITYNNNSRESLLWYGHLVTQCEIKRDLNLPAPAGVRFMFNKYELFINPLLFGLYSTEEQIAILKHEMLHIINLHIIRQKDRDPKKWNYATDIAINQLIPNIPLDGLTPEKFSLEKNLSAEQYYAQIPTEFTDDENQEGQGQPQQGQGSSQSCSGGQCQSDGNGESQQGGQGQGNGEGDEQQDGQGGSGEPNDEDVIDDEQKLKDLISRALDKAQEGQLGDHSKWGESQGNEQAAKEITRQMAETATEKSRGMTPGEAEGAIQLLKMKEQIDWKKELRRIVGHKKAFSRLTIKKRDRRFPNRKDLRGKTRDHVADILVVLDVSGSMSDEEIVYGLNEIQAIAEKAGAGVKIIQVDTEPKIVEDFDPNAKTFNRMGYGGTYLWPAIEFANKEKIRFDACVLITDGWIENEWPQDEIPKVPFIWLVTGDENNLSLDIGNYKRMKKHTLKIEKQH